MITYELACKKAIIYRDSISTDLSDVRVFEMNEDWAFEFCAPVKDGAYLLGNSLCLFISKTDGVLKISCCPSKEWFEVWEFGKPIEFIS